MGTYTTVLFDLFHTLVDVGSAPNVTGLHTADILGVPRNAWRRVCFSGHHDIRSPTRHVEVIRRLAHAIDPAIDEARIQMAAEMRQRRFDHALREVERETLDVLRELRSSGYRLGLLSNASSGEVAAWPQSPLRPFFDIALFSCEVGYCKPEAAFYRRALDSLNVRPEETIFVGDGGSEEHAGAAAVGLTTVLVTRFIRGDPAAVDFAARRRGVVFEIGDLGELPALLAG